MVVWCDRHWLVTGMNKFLVGLALAGDCIVKILKKYPTSIHKMQ